MNKSLLAAGLVVLCCGAAAAQPARYDADTAARIAKATPPSLPQLATDGRLTTDAQNCQLKGKVRVVTYRRTNDSEPGYPKKMLVFEQFYNEDGNLNRIVQWDNTRPYSVTVYGYIDGMRVSRLGVIEYADSGKPIESCVPLVHTVPSPMNEETERDDRYHMREIYRYDAFGRLVESSTLNNMGGLWTRTTYTYESPYRRIMLFWAGGKEPVGKTLEIAEPSTGNVTEEWIYDADKRYVHTVRWHSYKLDDHGNWIVRRTMESRPLSDDRRKMPAETTYRTITYYP